MITWQVVTCPHCGDTLVIDVDVNLFSFKDVHAKHLPQKALGDEAIERAYHCALCQQKFFATLVYRSDVAVRG